MADRSALSENVERPVNTGVPDKFGRAVVLGFAASLKDIWNSFAAPLPLLILAILAGGAQGWLLLGWHTINPRNLGWIHADPMVYQAGWEFLRHQSRLFPPAWIDSLDYPFGISAAYLDVIPIIAVPLHYLSSVLPENFQYLGLYGVTCFILQAYFGFRLVSRFTNDMAIILFGGLFYLNSPIFLSRLSGHFSLSSQWLILAALCYYFQPERGKSLFGFALPFFVLLAISSGITPYIAFMVLLISLAALSRRYFEDARPVALPSGRESAKTIVGVSRSVPIWTSHAAAAIVMVAITLVSLVYFGFITWGQTSHFEGSGYTVYSMNLLSPFSPLPFFGFLPVLPGQGFEGFNYLGLGIMLLLIQLVTRRPSIFKQSLSPAILPIFVLSLVLTLLALSVRISLGPIALFTVPVPHRLFEWLSVFRSSGRLFWPVLELLFLLAIVGTLSSFRSRWTSRIVLAIALLFQLYDTVPSRAHLAGEYQISHSSPLLAPDWAALVRHAKHLVILPPAQCDPFGTPGGDSAWPWFVRLAARNGMTLNSTHSGRPSTTSNVYNCQDLPELLLRRGPDPDSAYVLNDAMALHLRASFDRTDYCRRIDGLNLCTFDPRRAPLSRSLPEKLLPHYVLGTEFRADKTPPNSMIFSGWSLQPGRGIWTVGHSAAIYIRPARTASGDLRLDMQFLGALLNARHSLQRAAVTVNGHSIGTLRFAYKGDNRERSLVIPGQLVGDAQVLEIDFDLPDAAVPGDIGAVGGDQPLALCVSRIRVVAS